MVDWRPPVLLTSALEARGITEVWETIGRYRKVMNDTGEFQKRRAQQAKNWLWSEVGEALIDAFKAHPGIDALLKKHEKAVIDGKMAPSAAARVLLETFLGKET
jgi:LAO/AO transport system kinase